MVCGYCARDGYESEYGYRGWAGCCVVVAWWSWCSVKNDGPRLGQMGQLWEQIAVLCLGCPDEFLAPGGTPVEAPSADGWYGGMTHGLVVVHKVHGVAGSMAMAMVMAMVVLYISWST